MNCKKCGKLLPDYDLQSFICIDCLSSLDNRSKEPKTAMEAMEQLQLQKLYGRGGRMNWKEYSGMHTLKIDSFEICVHKYVGCGDEYFVTCHQLDINRQELKCNNLKESKVKAVNYILRKLLDKMNYFTDIHGKLYSIMCDID